MGRVQKLEAEAPILKLGAPQTGPPSFRKGIVKGITVSRHACWKTIHMRIPFGHLRNIKSGIKTKTLCLKARTLRHRNGRLIFIHHRCWEVLSFLTNQRQWCIKFRVLRAQDFYTPLPLNCPKGQHLPALVVYKNQSLKKGGIQLTIPQENLFLCTHFFR